MHEGRFLIHGAGGFGREVAWLLSELDPAPTVEAFLDDGVELQGVEHGGVRVRPSSDFGDDSTSPRVIAIGSGTVRRAIASEHAKAPFPAIVDRGVRMSRSVQLGHGSIVCAGSILTVNVVVGTHAHINLDCTIGHDVVIEDFVTLAPGVHVSGNVRIGEGSYIGTGANIINGTASAPLVIAPRTTVGAGACIIGSTEPDSLYVGVPAKRRK